MEFDHLPGHGKTYLTNGDLNKCPKYGGFGCNLEPYCQITMSGGEVDWSGLRSMMNGGSDNLIRMYIEANATCCR